MLTIDRPWEAEKIYRGILRFDPKNAAALAGLRDVAQAKRPTFQALTHYYVDTHDVELFTYGGGPTFRFPWGRATITAGTGHYRNNNDPNNERNPLSLTPDIPSAEDNDTLRKSTLNLILEPIYKKWEGNFLVSRVTYDAAPDRTLFDLKISNVQSPRERYSVVYLRQDSFYQSQAQQFFAPENFFMVVDGITYHAVGGSIEYPLAPRLDFGSFGRYFRYSDGNERYNLRNYLFYRIKGDNRRPMPIFRAGIDVILDDSKFFTLDYSASEHFNAYSLAADYVWLSRRTKYIIYGSVPIGKENFEPPAALILSYRRKVSRGAEFYLNINGFVAPGVSISFGDYVLGFHKSF